MPMTTNADDLYNCTQSDMVTKSDLEVCLYPPPTSYE